jgi:DNA-binding HxlR family transcriptional regulator
MLPVPPGKSGCPVNMTAELLGDRWSLIVLRDIMFGRRTHFRELMANSLEGIASNILAARLSKLVASGLLTRHDDPSHKQKVEYHLTEAAIQLLPVIAALGEWGARWLPTQPQLAVRAEMLADGGAAMWEDVMDELRAEHLESAPRRDDGILASLDRAASSISAGEHVEPGESQADHVR